MSFRSQAGTDVVAIFISLNCIEVVICPSFIKAAILFSVAAAIFLPSLTEVASPSFIEADIWTSVFICFPFADSVTAVSVNRTYK